MNYLIDLLFNLRLSNQLFCRESETEKNKERDDTHTRQGWMEIHQLIGNTVNRCVRFSICYLFRYF